MTLKKRIFKNGLASIFQKGVRVLEQLFLVPFFISAWGAAYYGEWLTLTIIPSVISFSNLGFGSAAANSFILSYSSGNKQEAVNISRTGMYIISIMVGVAMVISIIVLLSLNYFDVFAKSLIDSNDAIIAVTVLIFTQLLSFYLQLIESYYRAAQRASLSINLISTKSAANLGVGLLVLLLGKGVVTFAISQFLVMAVFMAFYWWKGRKVIGVFQNFVGHIDKTLLKVITTKGLSYLMLPLWQIIYFQGTTFIVRIVLGAESVAVFNTVRTLSRSFNQILYMVEPTVFPELINQIGRGDWKMAQKIYRISVLGVFAMSLVGCSFLALFGLWFYGVWTNNELEVPRVMWYLFISAMLFNALWYTTEMVFRAVNEPKKMGFYGLIAAILSIGLTYLFSNYMGLSGAALGAVSLDLILVMLVMPEGLKVMKMSLKDLVHNFMNDLQEIITKARGLVLKFGKA